MPRCEVPNQTLEVLGSSSHQKLFANVFESAQPDAAESDPILQLAEQGLDLPSTALMLEELGSLGSLSRSLPHGFFHMNDDLLVSTGSAFAFLRGIRGTSLPSICIRSSYSLRA